MMVFEYGDFGMIGLLMLELIVDGVADFCRSIRELNELFIQISSPFSCWSRRV